MDPVAGMLLCWAAFSGTHVGLATRPARAWIVRRTGEAGFGIAFSLVASATFAALVAWYASHRTLGPAGLALGTLPAVRPVLIALVVLGVVLVAASLDAYPASPYVVGAPHGAHEPRGVARVTRHPFFVGIALVGLAHALLATRLVGTVFALGFVPHALAGGCHQDRKLLRARGAPYAAYLATTSFVPFAAIAAGRQRLAWEELRLRPLATGVVAAVALRVLHAHLFDAYGAGLIGATVGGAAVLVARGVRAQRRRAARAATPRTMSETIARAAATGSDASAIGRPTTR
jgi:uncharacterized membrane protein